MKPSLGARASDWLDRPLGRGPTLILGALLCVAAAWLMADPLGNFILLLDDFPYLAESRTWPRVLANLWTPHNAHVVPLFRLWTFLLVMLAGRLENLQPVVGTASYGVLVLVMILGGRFVARETNDPMLGLAAMALLGLTTVMEPATVWYSAGQALWSGLGILAMLTALQSWRISGGAWRLVLAVLAAVASVGFWSGGYASGPVGMAYVWADGRPRCRWAAALPLVATILVGLAALSWRGRDLLPPGEARQRSFVGALHPMQGILYTCQAIPEALVMGNLGLDTITTASQGVVLMLALVGLWTWSRWGGGRLNPLEASGAMLVATSSLLVYTFRGYEPYSSLRSLGWYHAIPQVGAVLFVVGWWEGLRTNGTRSDARRPLVSGGAAAVVALALVLLVMQVPRAERLFVGADAGAMSSAEQVPAIADSPRERFFPIARDRARQQRQFLARLDAAEGIGRRDGIGRRAIKAVYGRIIGPGMPREIESLDAADLLALPAEGSENDSKHIRAALGNLLGPAR